MKFGLTFFLLVSSMLASAGTLPNFSSPSASGAGVDEKTCAYSEMYPACENNIELFKKAISKAEFEGKKVLLIYGYKGSWQPPRDGQFLFETCDYCLALYDQLSQNSTISEKFIFQPIFYHIPSSALNSVVDQEGVHEAQFSGMGNLTGRMLILHLAEQQGVDIFALGGLPFLVAYDPVNKKMKFISSAQHESGSGRGRANIKYSDSLISEIEGALK